MPKPKIPETVNDTWDELEAAITGVLETWNTETLVFFASDGVAEVNGMIAQRAQELLAERGVDYH